MTRKWNGAKYMSQIAVVKTVGGIVYPHHGRAGSKEWLQENIPGYGTDVKAARAEARKLLKEAGYPNLKAELYLDMLNEPDEKKQYVKMRACERYLIGEKVYYIPGLWWYRIIAHRSYFKGWKISPSHYLNQQLTNVWIDPKLR